jgi:hypothetical protein
MITIKQLNDEVRVAQGKIAGWEADVTELLLRGTEGMSTEQKQDAEAKVKFYSERIRAHDALVLKNKELIAAKEIEKEKRITAQGDGCITDDILFTFVDQCFDRLYFATFFKSAGIRIFLHQAYSQLFGVLLQQTQEPISTGAGPTSSKRRTPAFPMDCTLPNSDSDCGLEMKGVESHPSVNHSSLRRSIKGRDVVDGAGGTGTG